MTPRDDLERGDTPSCNLSCVIEDSFGESKRNEGENLPTTCINCLFCVKEIKEIFVIGGAVNYFYTIYSLPF